MLIDVEDNIPKEWWKKPKSNADDDSEINSSFAASDLAVVIGECNFSFPFALDNAHDARHAWCIEYSKNYVFQWKNVC